MENQKQTSFTFEIENFSEKENWILSPIFVSGGCEWFIGVHPKGNRIEDYLSVYLCVANRKSLRPGWKRMANYCLIVLNQSGKELKRTPEACGFFCAQFSSRGYFKMLPLSKLWFLENNKLIIKAEVKVIEVVHEAEVTGKEMLDIKGFEVLYTQVFSVSRMFAEHPDIAVDFKPKDKGVKTAYMNLLLGLTETLRKSPESLSVAEISNAGRELTELTEAGFKLDWLKSKLEEVSLERKKSDGSRIQQHEERLKNLELMVSDLKVDLDKEKIKSACALTTVSSFGSFIMRFFLSCFSISKQ